MQDDEFIARLCDDLRTSHAAHTILLYGSHADGSASADSDYDLAAFAPIETSFRIARVVEGRYLDAFVYPEALLLAPTEELLKLRESRILLERDTAARDFLSQLDAIHLRGPTPLPADEIDARKVWAHKMLARMTRGDAEGHYRRVWLLWALLEDYFHLRGQWYEGPKRALRWLQQFDPLTHDAMRLALAPNASDEAIAALVHRVVGDADAGLSTSDHGPR